jgi:predicted lactoylglutathione lyase
MKLGAFSFSLSVKEIHKSLKFYEKLGFAIMGGDINQKWLILKNEKTIIFCNVNGSVHITVVHKVSDQRN